MSKITINTVGQLLDNVETEEKATKLVFYIKELQQENKQLKEQINEYQKAVDETTSEKIDLQDENKQLKELKYKFFDNCGDEEGFTLEDYLEIGNKLYDYEEENKQLKEEIENIKDFNNKLQASKDRLDKDDYNLAHILTELEEWLKELEQNVAFEYQEYIEAISDTLDKIQKLKEKYK